MMRRVLGAVLFVLGACGSRAVAPSPSLPVEEASTSGALVWPGRGCALVPEGRIEIDSDECPGGSRCRLVATWLDGGAWLYSLRYVFEPEELAACGEHMMLEVDGATVDADPRPTVISSMGFASSMALTSVGVIGNCSLPTRIVLCPGTPSERVLGVTSAMRATLDAACANPERSVASDAGLE